MGFGRECRYHNCGGIALPFRIYCNKHRCKFGNCLKMQSHCNNYCRRHAKRYNGGRDY